MGAICDYDLWVLGDGAESVVPHLREQGWSVVKETEMGIQCELRSGNLHLSPPRIPDHPELLVVMSASHDQGGRLNHVLHTAQWSHHVTREWQDVEERDSNSVATVQTRRYDT